MSYSTVVREARFNVGDVSEGTCIHMWKRVVTNDVVMFTAKCGPDDGSGRCKLCWKQAADADGNLILTYTCDDIDCLGAAGSGSGEGCVLQYSLDGIEFSDVTPEEPTPDEDCYFRCQCGQ